jgi:hypothetical protein
MCWGCCEVGVLVCWWCWGCYEAGVGCAGVLVSWCGVYQCSNVWCSDVLMWQTVHTHPTSFHFWSETVHFWAEHTHHTSKMNTHTTHHHNMKVDCMRSPIRLSWTHTPPYWKWTVYPVQQIGLTSGEIRTHRIHKLHITGSEDKQPFTRLSLWICFHSAVSSASLMWHAEQHVWCKCMGIGRTRRDISEAHTHTHNTRSKFSFTEYIRISLERSHTRILKIILDIKKSLKASQVSPLWYQYTHVRAHTHTHTILAVSSHLQNTSEFHWNEVILEYWKSFSISRNH